MNLEKRMYFFVPYNISPIQQAIQAGHAVEQYAHKYGQDEDYVDYVENWKTWIILNGGTTNKTRDLAGCSVGTLNQITDDLAVSKIKFAYFEEPDLNDALTAVCFLVDERVYDYEKYPDWDGSEFWEKHTKTEPHYSKWVKSLGGKKNVFLRELLKYKKLA